MPCGARQLLTITFQTARQQTGVNDIALPRSARCVLGAHAGLDPVLMQELLQLIVMDSQGAHKAQLVLFPLNPRFRTLHRRWPKLGDHWQELRTPLMEESLTQSLVGVLQVTHPQLPGLPATENVVETA